jgi:hypothetical protein
MIFSRARPTYHYLFKDPNNLQGAHVSYSSAITKWPGLDLHIISVLLSDFICWQEPLTHSIFNLPQYSELWFAACLQSKIRLQTGNEQPPLWWKSAPQKRSTYPNQFLLSLPHRIAFSICRWYSQLALFQKEASHLVVETKRLWRFYSASKTWSLGPGQIA